MDVQEELRILSIPFDRRFKAAAARARWLIDNPVVTPRDAALAYCEALYEAVKTAEHFGGALDNDTWIIATNATSGARSLRAAVEKANSDADLRHAFDGIEDGVMNSDISYIAPAAYAAHYIRWMHPDPVASGDVVDYYPEKPMSSTEMCEAFKSIGAIPGQHFSLGHGLSVVVPVTAPADGSV
jgi:hypothetical protein